ncbi:MAG: hypothetical protein ACRDZO_07830 [Egibacteraceae bacterium]
MPMPPGVVRFTEPFLHTFLPVPPIQPGVCRMCHGAADRSDSLCWSCRKTMEQVTRTGHPSYAGACRPRVAGLAGRFLAEHEQCLGPWDIVTTVPSGQSRQGTHPLVTALHMLPLRKCHRRLLRPDPAAPRGAHLAASDDRFTLAEEGHPERVAFVRLFEQMQRARASCQAASLAHESCRA